MRNFIIYRETQKTDRQEQTIEDIKDGRLVLQTSTEGDELFDPEEINNRLNLLSFNLNNININEISDEVYAASIRGLSGLVKEFSQLNDEQISKRLQNAVN